MRASPHLLADCEAELKRQPDKTGAAYIAEYAKQLRVYERVVEEGNFGAFNREDERLSDCVRRLKNFCDRKQRERTERPRKT